VKARLRRRKVIYSNNRHFTSVYSSRSLMAGTRRNPAAATNKSAECK
jgi:hypothetical protein